MTLCWLWCNSQPWFIAVMTVTVPRCGDVLRLTRAASVQFFNPFLFRVIRVSKTDTADADGWAWLDGYQLGDDGEAVERRSVFVQLHGLRPAPQIERAR